MTFRNNLRVLVALMLLVTGFSSAAEPTTNDPSPVQATLLPSVDAAVPGQEFLLGVRMKLKPHWHTYWINPGESGAATKVVMSGPAGFEFGEIQWPLPTRIEIDGGVTYGYEDEVLLLIPVKAPKELGTTGNVTLTADASWLVCKESCIEGNAKLSIKLPIAAQSKPANAELFEKWRAQLPMPKEKGPEVMSKVEEAVAADGSPWHALEIQWRAAPRKVEWFPIATDAVAIENVKTDHQGGLTKIRYKSTVYKADQVPRGQLDSVVVYEDAKGQRRGVVVPVRVIQQR
jgi:DsbC/DsbD-like thiol-disulfide interchange protein